MEFVHLDAGTELNAVRDADLILLTDIPQMVASTRTNLTQLPLVDKLAGANCRSERLPFGPKRLGGLKGMVFFLIETQLSCRFQSDARHPNALRR